MARPQVSVVTPFYNTARWLPECIESVLGQRYGDFEYLLVNNRSTDGSREICAHYAALDRRIRLIDNDQFVGQSDNYNGALARVAPGSKYVKVAQADDVLYPECLEAMVALAEAEPTVGVVSSYYLNGANLDGGGVSRHVRRIPGREAVRRMLLERLRLTGSPTTVMYRADLVRNRPRFYPPNRYFPDTEAAFELLLESDLGYVHQVLSFARDESESITGSVRNFDPLVLHFRLALERYGPEVLSEQELARERRALERDHLASLARTSLLWGRRMWAWHKSGLATVGLPLRWYDVAPAAIGELLRLLASPGQTFTRGAAALDRWRQAHPRPPANPGAA